MRPALELRELRKAYGPLAVLHGVNLSVPTGKLVFIIGPSGSGKSTLLRCCNLLEVPESGAVMVDGKDITLSGVNLNDLRQQVGMVFQSFNLYPHMTVLFMRSSVGPVRLKIRANAGAEGCQKSSGGCPLQQCDLGP